jgi:dolichyl-diphosphooligosaccharide--protein glycosyltransferase
MLFTYYLWIKAVKTGSIFWSAMCALAYFYMVIALLTTTILRSIIASDVLYRVQLMGFVFRCPAGVATFS